MTAKALFTSLRSNAAALNFDTTGAGIGISSGVKTFGTTLQTNAVSTATAITDSIHLDQMAFALWQDYKSGATTNPSTAPSAFSGCTVFQGAFPTTLGQFNTDFVPASVTATSATNATWVGCSKNSGALPTNPATRRYRQTKVYDMAGATAARTYPASVPYLAVTRSQNTTVQRNLTPAFSGTVGFGTTVASPTGFTLKGDLPPLTDSAGNLLADHYTADLNGSTSTHASGARQATLTSGKFTSVPLAASTSSTLTVNLSNAVVGTSSIVAPNDNSVAAQVAATQGTLYATISDATGTLTGSLVADRFFRESDGSVNPGHAKFDGTASVVPNGSAPGAAQVSFLAGTLELTNSLPTAGVDRVLTFGGKLTLPQRPEAKFDVKITEPTLQTGTSTSEAVSGSYTQNGLTVNFSGTRTPAGTNVTFSDSNQVTTTISSTANRSNVTVGGRQTAVIDKGSKTIIYSDGTTESLL